MRIFFLFLILISFAPLMADDAIKSSIVKIYSVYSKYNFYQPWQKRGQQEANGSGCVIDGRLILTNAHVVSDTTFIQVKKAGEVKKYTATVKEISHAADLAVLGVEDPAFFENTAPLELSSLANVRDKVAVYGFPRGGDELSITEGVVSRIEHLSYAHSGAFLLSCQIDAAINPGNSGGPVIKDGKIAGVAFQANTSGENIGYMIPVPVIEQFLKDIADGRYDGIPKIGAALQNMESPSLRKKYRMPEDLTGVLINRIEYASPAEGLMQVSDILLSVDGMPVENDGTIEFRKGERTSLGYIAQNRQIGDSLKCGIMRNGVRKNVTVKLSSRVESGRLVPNFLYDTQPSYYIYGGLLFMPLSRNFLAEWGGKWFNDAPVKLLNLYYNGYAGEKYREAVVLVKIFADEINTGYHGWGSQLIKTVNGTEVSELKDVVQAFERNTGEYHIIETDDDYKIVLSRAEADLYSGRILERYKIDADRSPDLK